MGQVRETHLTPQGEYDLHVKLKDMDDKNPSDRYFLDHDRSLLSCGKASFGFYGLLNQINEKKWNVSV